MIAVNLVHEGYSGLIVATNVIVTTMPLVIRWMVGASARRATPDFVAKNSVPKAIGAKTATRPVSAKIIISSVTRKRAASVDLDSLAPTATCTRLSMGTRLLGAVSIIMTTTVLLQ